MSEREPITTSKCPDIMGLDVLPQLQAESKLELVSEEATGTFDEQDIAVMAERGFIVQSVAWGQAVYRRVEEE